MTAKTNEGEQMTEIVTTIKGGRDFDAPWIVLHADTIEEALGQLNALGSTDIATLAANAARSFQAQYAATGLGQTTVVPAAAPAPQAAPVVAAPAAPAANGDPSCVHGARVFKEAKPGTGTWKAWFCPTPKNTPGQCDPEWVK